MGVYAADEGTRAELGDGGRLATAGRRLPDRQIVLRPVHLQRVGECRLRRTAADVDRPTPVAAGTADRRERLDHPARPDARNQPAVLPRPGEGRALWVFGPD